MSAPLKLIVNATRADGSGFEINVASRVGRLPLVDGAFVEVQGRREMTQ